MKYMNRICTLISSGKRVAEVAVLYHAEAEWAGRYMPCEKLGRVLEENQITFDIIPADVFAEPSRFNAVIGNPLQINTQEYKAFIVPMSEFITTATAEALVKLHNLNLPVVFIDELPSGTCDGDYMPLKGLEDCAVLSLNKVVEELRMGGIGEVSVAPADSYLRVLHTKGDSESYYIVNESAETYIGHITLPSNGYCFAYDAWFNHLEAIETETCEIGTKVKVVIEPRKSLIVIFGLPDTKLITPCTNCEYEVHVSGWSRSICESLDYPNFQDKRPVSLPDVLEKEKPEFSGLVRYETTFDIQNAKHVHLEINDAAEGVEVFVNGRSAGIQIVPTFRYDISPLIKPGKNELAIEVATTLERKCYPMLNAMQKAMVPTPSAKSGITGTIRLYSDFN
jgi:hypothetical protein